MQPSSAAPKAATCDTTAAEGSGQGKLLGNIVVDNVKTDFLEFFAKVFRSWFDRLTTNGISICY
jgi:hypothetical protein